MLKKTFPILLIPLFIVFFAVPSVSAQDEGIPLQKDVFLGSPIYGPEDLPEEITFNLYDSKDTFTLATIVRINIDEDDKAKRGEIL